MSSLAVRWRVVVGRLFAYAAVTLAFVCLIEFVFLLINLDQDADRPFLIDWEPETIPVVGRVQTYIDPQLGATYNPKALEGTGLSYSHGFIIHGDASDGRALVIVTLGGSTTEGLARDAWPKRLQGLLAIHGIPAVVWNGGISGYGSGQELLKLLRDGVTLKPDIVISYDGVNEVRRYTFADDLFTDPFLMRVIERAVHGAESRVLPNTVAFLRRLLAGHGVEGIGRGVPLDATPAAGWHRNVRAMKAVADAFGIRYLDFLQPALGVGSYRPSREELDAARRSPIRKDYDRFYPEARLIAKREDYIEDLTEVFAGRRGIYLDDCHVGSEGNLLVALAILDELGKRGWIPALPGAGSRAPVEACCCTEDFPAECLTAAP